MILEKFLKWMTREIPSLDQRVDRFITIKKDGTARFDVAAYLETEEGGEQLKRFTDQTDDGNAST